MSKANAFHDDPCGYGDRVTRTPYGDQFWGVTERLYVWLPFPLFTTNWV